MEKNRERKKLKWLGLLFLAIAAFISALATGQIIFNVVAIALAVYIYKFGNPILFKEYDEKRRCKYEEAQVVREAAQKAVMQKKIFKK